MVTNNTVKWTHLFALYGLSHVRFPEDISLTNNLRYLI